MMENMYAKDLEAERLQLEYNRLRSETTALERTQPGDIGERQQQDNSRFPLQSQPVSAPPIPQRNIRRGQIVP